MRISVDIPDEWMPELRIAVAKAGARSVAGFLRTYIQATITRLPEPTQVEAITQFTPIEYHEYDTQVERDAPEPARVWDAKGALVEKPAAPDRPLSSTEIIKVRQAAARVKHERPIDKKGDE